MALDPMHFIAFAVEKSCQIRTVLSGNVCYQGLFHLGIVSFSVFNRQYGAKYIAAMTTNLCGPGDNL